MIAWGIITVAAIAAVVIALVVAGASQQRSRRLESLREIERLGLRLVHKPPREVRDQLFEAFAPVKELRTGARGLLTHVSGELDGTPVTLIDHRYTTMAGQTPVTIRHIAAATPCPPNWRSVRLTRRRGLFGSFGPSRPRLDREQFNSVWRVRSDDEEFAILLLTPDLQMWLEEAPPNRESWIIGAGWVRCVWRGEWKGEDLLRLARRPAAFVSMAPPELDVYAPE